MFCRHDPPTPDRCPFCRAGPGGTVNGHPVAPGAAPATRAPRATPVPLPVARRPCVHEGAVVEPCKGCPASAEGRHVRQCWHPAGDRDRCTREPVGPAVQACRDCSQYEAPPDRPRSVPPGPPALPAFAPRAGDPACGVVVGSFKWPSLVELQIRTIRHFCGPLPILVSEDPWTPEATARLRRICGAHPDVTLVVSGERIGHVGGDIEAYRRGIVWGQERGLAVVCKLSQRFVGTAPRWLQDTARELVASTLALSTRLCRGQQTYDFRSECCWMRVDRWAQPGLLADLAPKAWGRPAEAALWELIGKHLGGLFWPTRLFDEDRHTPAAGALWHNSHTIEDYRTLAADFGVTLDPDLHVDGWQHDLARGEYLLG